MTDQRQLNQNLIAAAANGRLDLAEQAINQGADVDNDGGDTLVEGTPLSEAVKSPGHRMVQMLLEAGATPSGSGWCNPVCEAARCNNIEALKLLVDTRKVGAQVLGSALTEAAHHSRKPKATECVRYLIDAGAPINDTSALLKAAEVHNTEIIDLLIDNGCDLERFGAGALEVACRNGFYDTTHHLLKAGANPAKTDYQALRSALSQWQKASGSTNPPFIYERSVVTLIEHALDEPQHRDMVLMCAKTGCSHILTKKMISRLTSQKDMETIMRWAARNADGPTLTHCLELGANPRAQKSKALVWACEAGNQDCARLLINAGAVAGLARTQMSADHALKTLEASTPIKLMRDNADRCMPESLFF